jgi:hypothetical protein
LLQDPFSNNRGVLLPFENSASRFFQTSSCASVDFNHTEGKINSFILGYSAIGLPKKEEWLKV